MSAMTPAPSLKNSRVPNPQTNLEIYAVMPEVEVDNTTFPEGPIYLLNGTSVVKKFSGAGYGVEHIWDRHSNELHQLGYTEKVHVPDYVARILCAGSPIHPPNEGALSEKLVVLQANLETDKSPSMQVSHIAVVGYRGRLDRADGHYHVITAYPGNAEGCPIGTLLL